MVIEILGSGSWGTALAMLLGRKGLDVCLVGRNPEEIVSIRGLRENVKYLQGYVLPSEVTYGLLEEDRPAADLSIIAVPALAVSTVLPYVHPAAGRILLATKGLEPSTGRLMTEVAKEARPSCEIGVISGPNLAVEIAQKIPTAAVCAFANADTAAKVAEVFAGPSFRVYRSTDRIGLELAGSLKNVLAIGAGMSDGLQYGDNTKGALLARGLKEMIDLGLRMKANLETFMGVGGVGDLFATSASKHSRNYRLGFALGQGHDLREAMETIGQVTEGVGTSEGVMHLAQAYEVEMPIFKTIDEVIRGRLRPLDAVRLLMDRSPQADGLA